ncbi:hypothetical protein KBY55_17845 [Streptomyces sp. b94]|uniref:hypothetical protein n=1 Tax=Streptomyces sp. b94 TaxID=1827634 RepID=UPI001B36BF4E|nr:hypothetical protein [Streptomyces sp. b94]MBQ1097897.1 hypothetical protein [Streptomyces sp. b94]
MWPRHARQGPPLPGGPIDILVAWQRGELATHGPAGLDQDDDPLEFAGFVARDDRAYW